MKYDDASWHSGDGFPENSPAEYSGTHIAIFMKWCFSKGWAGELHTLEEPDAVQRVIEGNLSATDFFFKYCDGKLTDEDFNEEGNKFASQYYGDDGLYFSDFADLFDELIFESPEDSFDLKILSEVMESRYQTGVLTESDLLNQPVEEKKPWWKF